MNVSIPRLVPLIVVLFYGCKAFGQANVIQRKIADLRTKVPLSGVTFSFGDTGRNMVSDAKGYVSLNMDGVDSVLVSLIGYETRLLGHKDIVADSIIFLTPGLTMIEDVQVVSTGYKQSALRKSVGAVDVIGTSRIDRMVSKDIMSRIANNSPGILFNHGMAESTDAFLVRGRSTISADARPLIILDNFPYEGNIENINPNDIENVTILKDASAASIWGARAANGVIVMTSKQGKTESPTIGLKSTVSYRNKPDLYNIRQMSSSDLLDLTKILYDKGLFEGAKGQDLGAVTMPVPQAVEILMRADGDAEKLFGEMRNNDVVRDIRRFLYQQEAVQQYNVNIRGVTKKTGYYLSGGYDKELGELKSVKDDRITLRSNIDYRLSEKLSLALSSLFSSYKESNGHNSGMAVSANGATVFSYLPYERLVDSQGGPLAIYPVLRKGYVDTIGNGTLLDWNYRPVDEIYKEKHLVQNKDFLYTAGVKYKFLDCLDLGLKYQYENQRIDYSDIYDGDSFYARHEINRFSRLLPEGTVERIIPNGGIYMDQTQQIDAHQFRAQLNFEKSIGRHGISSFAGYEIRHKKNSSKRYKPFYGYNPDYSTTSPDIDYTSYYPILYSLSTAKIPGSELITSGEDNFLSYYGNLRYDYSDTYFFEGNIRKDEANLFGVRTNQKGTPLWSVGGAWEISREDFFGSAFIPYLKFRLTYGVNGNISRATSAYSTLTVQSGVSHSLPSATVNNPPNESLRWERVKMVNIGLEFALKERVLYGKVDLYNKNSKDLLALVPTDPTLGFSSVYANSAMMRTQGVDVELNGRMKMGKVVWQSGLNYAHNRNRITEYLMPVSNSASDYIAESSINPMVGYPLYAMFSYKWAGLNPENGEPVGYVQNVPSEDYASIYNSGLDQLNYHGSLHPTHFGNFLNTVGLGGFNLSFNISFQFGGYFRAPSVHNSGLLSGWGGHSDYAKRWKKTGDEKLTNVPALNFTMDSNRDFFYRNSEIHVQKSDVIRLEDINLSYSVKKDTRENRPLIVLFFNMSDVGMLWKANEMGIDPYYVNVPLRKAKLSFGTNITF